MNVGVCIECVEMFLEKNQTEKVTAPRERERESIGKQRCRETESEKALV